MKRSPVKRSPETMTPAPEKISIGRGRKLRLLVVCIVVFLAGFLVYSNTLKSDFIWDDEYLILNNTQIKSFTHLKNVFRTYVGYGSENINNFYRPIQELSNMIDYYLWGEYPFGFHLTNVVLHSLVGMMVMLLLYYISGDILPALIGALLYTVHPVHTEAVAYIAGRADPLYSFFMLLSLVLFIRYTHKVRSRGSGRGMPYLGASLFFFMVSILSKEIALMMPLFIFLYMFYFVRGRGEAALYDKIKWSWVPYGVISAFYAYLRMTVLSFSDIAPASAFVKIPLVYRLLTFFRTILVYFRLMVFPADLHMERSLRISKSLMEVDSLIALSVVVAVLFLAYYAYRKNRLVSFCIVWFFANLIPVSNIVPINSFLAEHWIYMASIGPFLLFGLGAAWVYRKISGRNRWAGMAFLAAVAVLISSYGWATVRRNRDWKDEISFFNSTLKHHPRNARLYLNLGNTYYEKAQIDKAIEQYQKAIDINRNYAVAYGNIGSAYLRMKKPEEAIEYLEKAVQIKDNYPIAHYNLGIVYFERKDYRTAVRELRKALEQLPQLYQAWNMLARTYIKLGNVEGARDAFRESLRIFPDQPVIKRALGRLQ